MKKVCVVGSTTFPLTAPVGAQIVDVLRAYGPEAVFLTRNAETGFDRFVATVALALGNRCFAFEAGGGGDVFRRDGEMVMAADELIAFVDPDQLHASKYGTAGVIERALVAGKPTRVATVAREALVWESNDEDVQGVWS